MKVKTKYKITKTFLASMSVAADNTKDEKEKDWWNKSEKFVNDITEMDFSQLSIGQRNWMISIVQKLRLEGM